MLPTPAKRSRNITDMTCKEKLDLMETELDLELRRMKQESSTPSKDVGRNIGTSLGPKTAAIKWSATNARAKIVPQAGMAARRESGEISFKEEGEVSYQSEGGLNLEPGEIYLGNPGAPDAKKAVLKMKKLPVSAAGKDSDASPRMPKASAALAGINPNKSVPANLLIKSVSKTGGRMPQIYLASPKNPPKTMMKVIRAVSPPAKLQTANKSPTPKDIRHVSDAIPELNMDLQPVSVSGGVKTLVKYK